MFESECEHPNVNGGLNPGAEIRTVSLTESDLDIRTPTGQHRPSVPLLEMPERLGVRLEGGEPGKHLDEAGIVPSPVRGAE